MGGPGCAAPVNEFGLPDSALLVTNRKGFEGVRKLGGRGGPSADKELSEVSGRVQSAPLLKECVCDLFMAKI